LKIWTSPRTSSPFSVQKNQFSPKANMAMVSEF
jgi:hypothetical protein